MQISGLEPADCNPKTSNQFSAHLPGCAKVL